MAMACLVLTDRHKWCIAPFMFNILNMNLLVSRRSAHSLLVREWMTQGCDVMELKLACLGSKEGNSLGGQSLSMYILQGVTQTDDLTID